MIIGSGPGSFRLRRTAGLHKDPQAYKAAFAAHDIHREVLEKHGYVRKFTRYGDTVYHHPNGDHVVSYSDGVAKHSPGGGANGTEHHTPEDLDAHLQKVHGTGVKHSDELSPSTFGALEDHHSVLLKHGYKRVGSGIGHYNHPSGGYAIHKAGRTYLGHQPGVGIPTADELDGKLTKIHGPAKHSDEAEPVTFADTGHGMHVPHHKQLVEAGYKPASSPLGRGARDHYVYLHPKGHTVSYDQSGTHYTVQSPDQTVSHIHTSEMSKYIKDVHGGKS